MAPPADNEGDRTLGSADRCPDGSFEDIYRVYSPVVRDFLSSRAVGVSRSDLPELVQEVFVRLWEHRERFRGDSSVKTYVLGIAKNVLRENVRGRHRRAAVSFDDVEYEVEGRRTDESRGLEAEETAAAIERAKSHLTPEQREAFELVHVLEIPVGEAAEMADCNPNQFRNRLYRARKALRELLRGTAVFLITGMTLWR